LEKLNSIDTNIKSLSSNISSVKDELKINQKDLLKDDGNYNNIFNGHMLTG
jgi:hypothetical protein